jgi:hypothetical protein
MEKMPNTLGREMQVLLRKLTDRMKPESDDQGRARIRSAALEFPLSVAHRYTRQGVRAYACPPATEWDFWINNSISWIRRDHPSIDRLDMRDEARQILYDRLTAWEAEDSGHGRSRMTKPEGAEA